MYQLIYVINAVYLAYILGRIGGYRKGAIDVAKLINRN